MVDALSGIKPVYPAGGELSRAPRETVPSDFGKPQTDAQDAAQKRHTAELEQAMKQLDQPMMGKNERLSIIRDEKTGAFVYRSVDRTTGDVINQWPAESMLQFKAYIREAAGAVVNQKI
jgi:flagellar protein FlaG